MLGWTLLTVVWSLTVLGILFKSFLSIGSNTIYNSQCCHGVACRLCRQTSLFRPACGRHRLADRRRMAYTLGTVFYLWKKLPFHHAIWHLFVLAGSICHFLAVFIYVVPSKLEFIYLLRQLSASITADGYVSLNATQAVFSLSLNRSKSSLNY